MTLEQVIEMRKIHEQHNMSVFRTEGVVHHETGDKAHLIWDDTKEVCHSINVNTNYSDRSNKIVLDSFCYEAITSIFSRINTEELKTFLKLQMSIGNIGQEEYDVIIADYK